MTELPMVGQVVLHHFLWVEEARAGRYEGTKARPCVVVAVESVSRDSALRVTVLPVTSKAPRTGNSAIAIPETVKTSMGLDRTRLAWIVIDDANVFGWPGFDLVPLAGGDFVRGSVTTGFFRQIIAAVSSAYAQGKLRPTERDESDGRSA